MAVIILARRPAMLREINARRRVRQKMSSIGARLAGADE
jgi:hypothetical protein